MDLNEEQALFQAGGIWDELEDAQEHTCVSSDTTSVPGILHSASRGARQDQTFPQAGRQGWGVQAARGEIQQHPHHIQQGKAGFG